MKRFLFLMVSVVALVLTGCAAEQEAASSQKASPESMVDESFFKKAATGKAYFRANSVKEPKDAEKVEFVDHVDEDTAKLKIDGKVETVRFLDRHLGDAVSRAGGTAAGERGQ